MKTAAEIHDTLETWLASYLELERQFDALAALVGRRDESPLETAAYKVHDAYTNALARQLGDAGAWLDWFLYDNDAGKRGLAAMAPGWKKPRAIRNLWHLAKLIRDCQ